MDGRTDDGRTDDGRTPGHGHPISSPSEPNGSGELITYRERRPGVRDHFDISGVFETTEFEKTQVACMSCLYGTTSTWVHTMES